MSQEQELAKKKKIRAGHRGHAHKVMTEAILEMQGISPSTIEMEHYVQSLTEKELHLRNLDEEIIMLIDDENIEREIFDAEERRTELKKTIPLHRPSFNIPNLPKLELPKYSGDPKRWNEWWDVFAWAIHENGSLTPVFKLRHLKTLLEGPAAATLSGLTLTSVSYSEAIELLKSRYGQTQVVINAHMEALLKMNHVPSMKDTKSLRKLYDEIEIHVRSLKSLGEWVNQLGWVLSGTVPSVITTSTTQTNLIQTHVLRVGVETYSQMTLNTKGEETLEDQLAKFWNLESIGITQSEDKSVLEEFVDDISFVEGRYEVKLQWKKNHGLLPDNSTLSLGRLNKLKKKLSTKPEMLEAYDETIREQEKNDKLLNALYVDDVTTGDYEEEKCMKIYSVSRKMMTDGGFNLRKWRTNSKDLQEKIETEERKLNRSTEVASATSDDAASEQKVLDSSGIAKKTWTDYTDDNTHKGSLSRDLYHEVQEKPTEIELHGFCDASQDAYAAAVYVKYQGASSTTTDLLISKTREEEKINKKEDGATSLLVTSTETIDTILPTKHFSCYNKLLRVLSYVKRFINNCDKNKTRRTGQLNAIEIKEAESVLIRDIQKELRSKENKQLKYQLGIYEDHDDELRTTVIEIEAVINSRPLTHIYDGSLEDPITPSHLVMGKKLIAVPHQQYEEPEDPDFGDQGNNQRRAKRLSLVLKHFQTRWKTEYLSDLREQHRNSGNKLRKPLITTDGIDNEVRGAKVRLANQQQITRPLQKLFPLQVCKEKQTDDKEKALPITEIASNEKRDNRQRRTAAVVGTAKRQLVNQLLAEDID
eukprot:gene19331-21255_t